MKDDEFFVFTDIVNGSPLHILNLETETVRIIEGSINTLFFAKFSEYHFFDDIKSNKVRGLTFYSYSILINLILNSSNHTQAVPTQYKLPSSLQWSCQETNTDGNQ